MELMEWLTQNQLGRMIFTMLVAMLPVVEQRGAIPFGVSLGLDVSTAFWVSLAGNMLPVPFIVVYIRRIFLWMRRHSKRLDRLVNRLEKRAHLNSAPVRKYRALGLFILVVVPGPGTGAWTASLIAALMNVRLRDAMLAIFSGVLLSGLAIAALTYGVSFFFF